MKMRMYRLLMPAATLAGALALAGCGGGSSTPGTATTTTTTTTNPGTTLPECAEGHSRRTPTGPCELDQAVSTATAAKAEYAKSVVNQMSVGSPARTPAGNFLQDRGPNTLAKPSWLKAKSEGSNDYEGRDSRLERGHSYVGGIFDTKGSDSTTAIGLETGWSDADGGHLEITGSTAAPRTAGVSISELLTATSPSRTILVGNNDAIEGSYYGVSGEYRCDSGTCTVNRGSGGTKFTLTGAAGVWNFYPDGATLTARKNAILTKPDSTYLEYGWWLGTDDGTGRAIAFRTHVRPTGLTKYVDNSAVAAIASATYEGDARGYYAQHDAINSPATGSHEAFQADVSLTADFTDGTAGTLAGSTVKGTIDNFRLASGAGSGWLVKLEDTAAFDEDTESVPGAPADDLQWANGGEAEWVSGSNNEIGTGEYVVGAYGTPSTTSIPAELGGAFYVASSNDLAGTGVSLQGAFQAKPQ